jgi:hypothetical protein
MPTGTVKSPQVVPEYCGVDTTVKGAPQHPYHSWNTMVWMNNPPHKQDLHIN